MTTKRRTLTQAQIQAQALDAYIDHLDVAREAAERVYEYIADNGETSPEQVNWGHVGSMAHIASQLKDLADMIDGTGEYSETD